MVDREQVLLSYVSKPKLFLFCWWTIQIYGIESIMLERVLNSPKLLKIIWQILKWCAIGYTFIGLSKLIFLATLS